MLHHMISRLKLNNTATETYVLPLDDPGLLTREFTISLKIHLLKQSIRSHSEEENKQKLTFISSDSPSIANILQGLDTNAASFEMIEDANVAANELKLEVDLHGFS